jgi:hypothetical protein
VIDLAQQGLEALVGCLQGLLGVRLGPFELDRRKRLAECELEPVDEIVTQSLDHIVGGAGLQRRDGNAALVGAGDVDDRWTVAQLAQLGDGVQPVPFRHVVVDTDQVERLRAGNLHPFGASRGAGHGVAATCKQLLDQPAQARVIVDVENPARRLHQLASASGTWITDRNSPSWRMASAKLS